MPVGAFASIRSLAKQCTLYSFEKAEQYYIYVFAFFSSTFKAAFHRHLLAAPLIVCKPINSSIVLTYWKNIYDEQTG